MISFNLHDNPVKQTVCPPFYRQGNQSSERLTDFSQGPAVSKQWRQVLSLYPHSVCFLPHAPLPSLRQDGLRTWKLSGWHSWAIISLKYRTGGRFGYEEPIFLKNFPELDSQEEDLSKLFIIHLVNMNKKQLANELTTNVNHLCQRRQALMREIKSHGKLSFGWWDPGPAPQQGVPGWPAFCIAWIPNLPGVPDPTHAAGLFKGTPPGDQWSQNPHPPTSCPQLVLLGFFSSTDLLPWIHFWFSA